MILYIVLLSKSPFIFQLLFYSSNNINNNKLFIFQENISIEIKIRKFKIKIIYVYYSDNILTIY